MCLKNHEKDYLQKGSDLIQAPVGAHMPLGNWNFFGHHHLSSSTQPASS